MAKEESKFVKYLDNKYDGDLEKILAAYKKQYESGTVSNNITELIVKFFISNADEK